MATTSTTVPTGRPHRRAQPLKCTVTLCPCHWPAVRAASLCTSANAFSQPGCPAQALTPYHRERRRVQPETRVVGACDIGAGNHDRSPRRDLRRTPLPTAVGQPVGLRRRSAGPAVRAVRGPPLYAPGGRRVAPAGTSWEPDLPRPRRSRTRAPAVDQVVDAPRGRALGFALVQEGVRCCEHGRDDLAGGPSTASITASTSGARAAMSFEPSSKPKRNRPESSARPGSAHSVASRARTWVARSASGEATMLRTRSCVCEGPEPGVGQPAAELRRRPRFAQRRGAARCRGRSARAARRRGRGQRPPTPATRGRPRAHRAAGRGPGNRPRRRPGGARQGTDRPLTASSPGSRWRHRPMLREAAATFSRQLDFGHPLHTSFRHVE